MDNCQHVANIAVPEGICMDDGRIYLCSRRLPHELLELNVWTFVLQDRFVQLLQLRFKEPASRNIDSTMFDRNELQEILVQDKLECDWT